MRVTEDELVLAAHYDFRSRLGEVVASTLTYQRDKRTHDRCAADAETTGSVLATARRLARRLPPDLRLVELAEAQDDRAREELGRARERLRTSADAFFDVAGRALPDVVAAMETHRYALDRPKLVAALRAAARVGAAQA